jgi:hypothetical protein
LIGECCFSLHDAQVTRLAEAEIPVARAELQGRLGASRGNAVRHLDGQSIAGLLAALRINASSRDWAVLAAPQTPGKQPFRTAVERFAAGGAWTVSPHVVPYCSLHSLAGVISVALGLTGPNLGVGGAACQSGDLWPTAAALLHDRAVPGVLAVFSSEHSHGSTAVALTLTAAAPGRPALVRSDSGVARRFTVTALADQVHRLGPGGAWGRWRLHDDAILRLLPAAAAARLAA